MLRLSEYRQRNTCAQIDAVEGVARGVIALLFLWPTLWPVSVVGNGRKAGNGSGGRVLEGSAEIVGYKWSWNQLQQILFPLTNQA
jgi:hypothetical protein